MREQFTRLLREAIERTQDASTIYGLARDLESVLRDLNEIGDNHGIGNVLYIWSDKHGMAFDFKDPYELSKGKKRAGKGNRRFVLQMKPTVGKMREEVPLIEVEELKTLVIKSLKQWLRLAGDIFPSHQEAVSGEHGETAHTKLSQDAGPPATVHDAPLWMTSLQRLQKRFEELARRHQPLPAALFQTYYPPFPRKSERTPSDLSFLRRCVNHRVGLSRSWLWLLNEDGTYKTTAKVMHDATGKPIVDVNGNAFAIERGFDRHVDLYENERASWNLFDVAKEAGTLLETLPEQLHDVIWREWYVKNAVASRPFIDRAQSESKWLNVVFELAWQRFSGSPLAAGRTVCIGGGKSGRCEHAIPFEAYAAMQQEQEQERERGEEPSWPGLPPLADQPPGWYSKIDNVLTASVQACDILLSLAREVNDAASIQSQELVKGKPGSFTFAPDGSGFLIKGFGESGHVNGLRGFQQIYMLLREPSHRVDMPSLAACETIDRSDARSEQATLDAQAKRELGDRLAELGEEKQKAMEDNNPTEADHCQEDMDRISAELTAATGLGGRDRDLNSDIGKLRPRIKGTLSTAYEKLEKSGMTSLANHFRSRISASGSDYFYDDDTVWNLNISAPQ